jgi:hypothetical protein
MLVALSGLLAACATEPAPRVAAAPPPPPAMTQIMVYPARGQTPEQLERDRYECHIWAVQQTGFDPSQPGAPAGRVVAQPANPPGTGTAVGAITGAILGAAIAGPHDAGFGALFGGVTGAAVGTASDANAQAHANYEQARLDAGYNAAAAQNAQRASNYRRAISACLDARGYTTA